MINKKLGLPRTKCTTVVNLFLAHRYAAVLIILLVGTGPDPRPVWCNAPLPLCNQTQTRWLTVLLQLPVWKALHYPHQCHYSHGLQTPLGSTDTTPKQSGQLFLPHDKNPSSAASAHWRQFSFFPPPSLYQVSRTVGLLGFGTDGIAGFSMVKSTLFFLERGIIRCSRLKTDKIPLFDFSLMRWGVWFDIGLQTWHFCSCGIHNIIFFIFIYGCSCCIYNPITQFSYWFTDILERYFI